MVAVMKERHVTVEEILATYSNHITKSYPSPEEFKERLGLLLTHKKDRMGDDEYATSLEMNIIFLHGLVFEGEALLDVLLGGKRKKEQAGKSLSSILGEMETKMKGQTKQRHKEAFIEGKDESFHDLFNMKTSRHKAYVEKLEFDYRYLMTLRILFFEFFNVLASVKSQYKLARMTTSASRRVLDALKLNAHYYLGNIEVTEENPPRSP